MALPYLSGFVLGVLPSKFNCFALCLFALDCLSSFGREGGASSSVLPGSLFARGPPVAKGGGEHGVLPVRVELKGEWGYVLGFVGGTEGLSLSHGGSRIFQSNDPKIV